MNSFGQLVEAITRRAGQRELWVDLPVPNRFGEMSSIGDIWGWCYDFVRTPRGKRFVEKSVSGELGKRVAFGTDYTYEPDDLNIEGSDEAELRVVIL